MYTDIDLIKEGIRQRRKRRAQSLTEFALILPVLLFFIMGVIDFGRVLFTYAQASAQIRAALRYASVVGYNTPVYLDCDLMRNTIVNTIFFDQSAPTVTIKYFKATSWNAGTSVFDTTYPNDGNCQGGPTSNDLTTVQRSAIGNGDILRISADISVAMMTPFFPSPLTFTLAGQRTLVTNISLVDAPYILPAPQALTQTADFQTFVAQLQDATNTAFVETATFQQGLTNTSVFNAGETATHQYQLDNGIPTFTPVPTIAGTATLPQVQNLQFWAGGARCSGDVTKRYIGLVWTRIKKIQGYFIYANGIKVGQTTDSSGVIRQCGRSLSANRTGRISGCFNLNPGAWSPGSSVNYEVAAFTGGGSVIGPKSTVLTKTC